MSDTLAAVLRQNVDLTALPASIPAPVRRLVARCLDRDVKRRLRDIGEARIALEDTSRPAGKTQKAKTVVAPPPARWRRAMPAVLSAIAAGTLAGAATWYLTRKPSPPLPVTRFSFALPEGQAFEGATPRHVIALSSDGAQMAYAANSRLFLRSMSDLDVRAIQGTEHPNGVTDPVFSPDGQFLVFHARDDQMIKKVPVAGGVARRFAQPRIRTASAGGKTASFSARAARGSCGSRRRVAPRPCSFESRMGKKRMAHSSCPAGNMCSLRSRPATPLKMEQGAHRRAARVTAEQAVPSEKRLIDGGSDARYLPTGHLVYVVDGSLFAVPFDVRRLDVDGRPRADGRQHQVVWRRTTGAYHFSISGTGPSSIHRASRPSDRTPWEMVTDRTAWAWWNG